MSVLITRPDEPGRQLTQHLNQVGIAAHHFPLISILPSNKNHQLQHDLECADIVIAVSQYAVTYADKSIKHWPSQCLYFAIGSKTALQLEQVTKKTVYTPEIHESEHFLLLPELSQSHIFKKKVIILRGNGGRDLIREQLSARGAYVEYREVYQRKNIKFDSKLAITEWQDNLIQHVVITSSEQLNHLLSMCRGNKSWLVERCIYVPSERIAQEAKALGFTQVVCTHGASNTVITRALQAHIKGNNNDQKDQ
ncbi:uroporphyrinogen-III synthase [Vibrio astriarenae]